MASTVDHGSSARPIGATHSLVPSLRPIRPARGSATRGRPAVPHGRYDGRHGKEHNTSLPPGGDLGNMPASRNRSTVVAAIADPMGDGEQRILASVNRTVDVLEHDRSHHLISEAAYRTGRLVQGVLEYSRHIGSSNWAGASRKDPAEVRDTHAQRMIDDGNRAQFWKARIRDRLGMIDMRLLQRVLGDGMSVADCAALDGKGGERGQRYVAARFRDALEDLAEAWTAKGKIVPPPADKHLEAAGVAPVRQALAIGAGATEDRLRAELDDLVQRKVKTAEVRRDIALLQERLNSLRQLKAGFGGVE